MSDRYPFSAIVGMDLAKKSLLLHAVNPSLGGVLLSGHRGCAKTTLARAFVDLLPDATMSEVPLGASEDRLLGSVDVSAVLERNEWSHQPGLLEQAHGGVLYVDEVNLLRDDLSDQLLDAAATGGYQLEREGMSRRVQSRFILVGTMNPEEGMLRPQLADRFAHSVTISTDVGARNRTEIIERRLRFEMDAIMFCERFSEETAALKQQIEEARKRLPQVELSGEWMNKIGEQTTEWGLEGMRGGLSVAKTALAAAAWGGRSQVSAEDLDLAWLLCLGHRQNENLSQHSPPASNPKNQSHEEKESPRSFPNRQGQAGEPTGSVQRTYPVDSEISQMPRGANEGAITQVSGPDLMENSLASWLRRPKAKATLRQSTPNSASGEIYWKDTLVGWLKDARRVRVRRFRTRQTRHLWVFLDASRSTAVNGFLAKSLTLLTQALNPLTCQSLRVHVLKLSRGKLAWMGQDMVAGDAGRALAASVEASGDSCLSEAFMEILRDARRRGAAQNDSVVVFSDGIATALNQDAAGAVQERMQRSLIRLSRMGPELRWFAPQPRRGFWHPVETLSIESICGAEAI